MIDEHCAYMKDKTLLTSIQMDYYFYHVDYAVKCAKVADCQSSNFEMKFDQNL